MGQHIVPQHYLEGFSDLSSPSTIWVYEKNSKIIFRSSVRSVANENKRWPKNTEDRLANIVEDPANLVLDKIRNRLPITGNDKDILSAYMITMIQRVPRGLERMQAIFPEVREKVFAELESKITKLITENPAKENILQNTLDKLPEFRSKYETEFPLEVWHQNIMPEALPRVLSLLPTMTWVFLTSDKKHPFLTNDNPVFFFEGLGMGKPDSEITFPVSSTITLWAIGNKNIVEGYLPAKESIIREINRRTASAATKYIYYSTKAPWVVSLGNRRAPKLHRIQ